MMKLSQIKKSYKKFINLGQEKYLSLFSFSKDVFEKSSGMYIYTRKNKKYLDLTGGMGVLNHGHNHPEILRVRINFQKKKYLEVHKNILSPHLAKLSEKVSKILPKELSVSFFPNSGAEANEGAIKAAFKYYEGKRNIILHSSRAFHGKLIATGAISSPLRNINFPKFLKNREFQFNNLNSLKKVIKKIKSKNIFAIIIEPFSASTFSACSFEFLKELRKICDQKKIILIYDEVYTGWGKTGYLFYFMKHKYICPDILTASKSLGGGKASIGMYIMKKKIFEKSYGKINDALLHSTTFNGFGEEAVTATKAIEILTRDKLSRKALVAGNEIKKNFLVLKKRFPNFDMRLEGTGCIQRILLKNNKIDEKILRKFLTKKNIKKITFLRSSLLEVSILDYLYKKFSIFAFHSPGKLVISPSLIIKKSEIKYLFKALSKTLMIGKEKLINNYISENIKSIKQL